MSCGWTVFGVMIIILYSIYYVRAICAREKMSLNKSLERVNVIIDNIIVYLNNQCLSKNDKYSYLYKISIHIAYAYQLKTSSYARLPSKSVWSKTNTTAR